MDTSNEIFIFIGVMLILLAASVQHMIPNPPATAVGVDLGTTFSCVAVFEDGEINAHAQGVNGQTHSFRRFSVTGNDLRRAVRAWMDPDPSRRA